MWFRVDRVAPRILIVWVLLGALVPRLSPFRSLYLVNTYLLLPALLGIALLDRVLRSRGRGACQPGPSDAALVLFLMAAVASIALQDQPYAATRQNLIDLWRTFGVPFTAFWVVRLTRPRERDLAAWAHPLAFLCLVEVAVGLLAWFTPAALPGFWPGSVPETGGVRITGTLQQADVYAAVLVFCAAFLMASALAPGVARWLSGGVVGGIVTAAFTGVFLTFSRASWLGGLLALGILAAAYGRRLALPGVAIALSVLALSRAPGGRAGPATPSPTATSPTKGAGRYAIERVKTTWSISDRIALDAAGLKMFLKKPLFGWGFGTYDRHARGFVTKVGPIVPSDWATQEAASHCTHLSILAEMGLLGYGLLIFPVVWLAAATFSGQRRLRQDPRLVGLWAIVAFLAVVSLLVDLRYVAPSLGLAWLVLGLIGVRLEADELLG